MRVACVQTCAGDDMAGNLAAVAGGIREAAAAGAEFITTPENVALMAADRAGLIERSVAEGDHPAVAAFAALAAETEKWILAGSIAVAAGDGRLSNRSLLFTPDGAIAARYDKIHMFDVELPDGEIYNESRNYRPGDKAVLANLPWGRLGLTICYDVRFPHLYRDLALAGAQVITVPSAFTRVTGRAHWEVLLRARAIETGAFVVAPAQSGAHPAKRETFGHSLVVAPWGEVLADAGEGAGVCYADLDLARVDKARQAVPAWQAMPGYQAPAAS